MEAASPPPVPFFFIISSQLADGIREAGHQRTGSGNVATTMVTRTVEVTLPRKRWHIP